MGFLLYWQRGPRLCKFAARVVFCGNYFPFCVVSGYMKRCIAIAFLLFGCRDYGPERVLGEPPEQAPQYRAACKVCDSTYVEQGSGNSRVR